MSPASRCQSGQVLRCSSMRASPIWVSWVASAAEVIVGKRLQSRGWQHVSPLFSRALFSQTAWRAGWVGGAV